jgi:hypothetical protein
LFAGIERGKCSIRASDERQKAGLDFAGLEHVVEGAVDVSETNGSLLVGLHFCHAPSVRHNSPAAGGGVSTPPAVTLSSADMLIVMQFMGRVHAVDDLLRLRVPCEGVSCRLGLLKAQRICPSGPVNVKLGLSQ